MTSSGTASSKPMLFGGLDRASFAAAFGSKLHDAGIATPLSSLEGFVNGLALLDSFTVTDLYWMSRVTFVKRREDLAVFDLVFEAIFDFELNRTVKQSSRTPAGAAEVTSTGRLLHRLPFLNDGVPSLGEGLRWNSPPSIQDDENNDDECGSELTEQMPSPDQAIGDRPFDQMNEADLAEMCEVLENTEWDWPSMRSRRMTDSKRSGKPNLRRVLQDSSRIGGEIPKPRMMRQRSKPRRVVMLLDVSGSMESYVRSYLHTSRLLVNRGHMEVFAVGTDLHRLTPALRKRSPKEAMELATECVGDRFGGTRLATNIGALTRHKTWGGLVRGAVVIIASDGWDTDDSSVMNTEMARLRRRSHSVIWINPRSAADGFEPRVAAMAAALPHCDRLLSGHTANAMIQVMDAVAVAR